MTSLQGLSALMVEDEPLVSLMMEEMLSDFGVRVVHVAHTLADAIAQAQTLDVAFATLDLKLNGESGLPVADALAARGVPFIFVSGYDDGALPERFRTAPLVGKPVSPEQLREVIERALRRTGHARARCTA